MDGHEINSNDQLTAKVNMRVKITRSEKMTSKSGGPKNPCWSGGQQKPDHLTA